MERKPNSSEKSSLNNNKSMSSSTVFLQDKDELQKVFNQFDTNHDGKISIDELGGIIKAMGTTYTDDDLQRVMDDVDADKDGFINIEEFSRFLESDSDKSELKDAFDLYDQNKNGLISSAELHKVLNRLGMTCSVDDCIQMIQNVDSDGDGCVNFEEFQKMMSANASA